MRIGRMRSSPPSFDVDAFFMMIIVRRDAEDVHGLDDRSTIRDLVMEAPQIDVPACGSHRDATHRVVAG